MAQIAQQDHLYVDFEDIYNPTDAEAEKVYNYYKKGLLYDIIVRDANETTMRFIASEYDSKSSAYVFYTGLNSNITYPVE